MPWIIGGGMALGAGGSIFSGLMGASGAAKAAASYRDAALINQQTAYTLDARARADLDPFAQVGRTAAPILSDLISGKANVADQLSNDPLFKWQSEELQRFNERGLAKQGLTNSGAGLELNRRGYAQLLGDNSQRYFNNLYNTVSLGENAAARTAANTMQTGANVMQSNTAAAQQIGAAQLNQGVAYGNIGTGVANAVQSGIGTTLNYNLYNALIQGRGSFAPVTQTGGVSSFNLGGSPFMVNTPNLAGFQ